jgi:hypothetical protein
MIVSSLHKFIFVAIPKTGTHSVRRALRQHLGPQDIEQVRLFEEKAFPIPELARLGHGHLSLREVQPFMSAKDFQSFFKFAFVRNPFDRFVSFSAFMTRAERHFDRAPQVVMRHFLANPSEHILFRPQHTFVTDAGGELMTDYVGRVEQMQQSYDEIAQRIGVPSAQLEKVNISRREDYRRYYDQPLIDGVASLYARDLELFGYEF